MILKKNHYKNVKNFPNETFEIAVTSVPKFKLVMKGYYIIDTKN